MSALLDPNGSSTPQGGGGGLNYWALMCDWVLPSLERKYGPVKLVDDDDDDEEEEDEVDENDEEEGAESSDNDGESDDENKADAEVTPKLKKKPSRRDESDNQSADSKQSHGSHDTAASAAAQAKRDALIAKIAKFASRMDPHRAPPSLRPNRGNHGQRNHSSHSRGSQRSESGSGDTSLDLYAFQAELEACLGLKLTLSQIDGLLRVFSARGDRRVDWADFVDWFWRIGAALAIADRKTEAQQQFIRVHSRNGERPRGSSYGQGDGESKPNSNNSSSANSLGSASPQQPQKNPPTPRSQIRARGSVYPATSASPTLPSSKTPERPTRVVMQLSEGLNAVINVDGSVSEVVSGGQADLLGLRPGCVVVGASGKPVTSLGALKGILADFRARGDSAVMLELAWPMVDTVGDESVGVDDTLHRGKPKTKAHHANSSAAKDEKHERNHAATKVQGTWRRRDAQQRVSAMKEEKQAATTLQSTMRRRDAQQRVSAMKEEKQAATTLQSTMRRREAQQRVSAMKEEKQAATILQSTMRRREAQQRVSAMKEEKQAATTLQSTMRRNAAKGKVSALRDERTAATKVQSLQRSRMARQEVQKRKLSAQQKDRELDAMSAELARLRAQVAQAGLSPGPSQTSIADPASRGDVGAAMGAPKKAPVARKGVRFATDDDDDEVQAPQPSVQFAAEANDGWRDESEDEYGSENNYNRDGGDGLASARSDVTPRRKGTPRAKGSPRMKGAPPARNRSGTPVGSARGHGDDDGDDDDKDYNDDDAWSRGSGGSSLGSNLSGYGSAAGSRAGFSRGGRASDMADDVFARPSSGEQSARKARKGGVTFANDDAEEATPTDLHMPSADSSIVEGTELWTKESDHATMHEIGPSSWGWGGGGESSSQGSSRGQEGDGDDDGGDESGRRGEGESIDNGLGLEEDLRLGSGGSSSGGYSLPSTPSESAIRSARRNSSSRQRRDRAATPGAPPEKVIDVQSPSLHVGSSSHQSYRSGTAGSSNSSIHSESRAGSSGAASVASFASNASSKPASRAGSSIRRKSANGLPQDPLQPSADAAPAVPTPRKPTSAPRVKTPSARSVDINPGSDDDDDDAYGDEDYDDDDDDDVGGNEKAEDEIAKEAAGDDDEGYGREFDEEDDSSRGTKSSNRSVKFQVPVESPLTTCSADDGRSNGDHAPGGGWGGASEDGGSVLVGSVRGDEHGEGSSLGGDRPKGNGSGRKTSKSEPSPSSEFVANYLGDGFEDDEDYEEPTEDTSVSDAASVENQFSDVEELDD